MSPFLAAMHDPGGEWAFGDKPGWIVHTEALEHSGKGDYSRFVAMGFRNIVRLNQGYGGLGTIPTPDRYDEFAAKCASFVTNSPGIDWVMIGNEPNHAQEWPDHQMITPTQYAKCFDLCYTAIRNTGRPVKVMTAAVAPWNQQAGDWLWYYRTMLSSVAKCDGFSLHAYTHGANADLIYSDHKVENWYWHFRTYLDQLSVIDGFDWPLSKPAFITETDQDETWRDANSGWVQNAFAEINAHNAKGNVRKIHCVALYRWQNVAGDKWGIESKNGVIDDFKAAVQRGYSVDVTLPGEPLPPTTPPPTQPPPITPPPDSRVLDWDARLTARGCTLQPALMPSDPAPLVRVGRWFNEEESQGRVNVFVRLLDENGNLATDVPVTWFWADGSETKRTERKSDPWLQSKGLPAEYSLDFSMYTTAPAYGIRIEGYSGDVIDGCGLGSIEQPDWNIHTSYYFEWKLSQVPEIITPPVEPPIRPFPPTDDDLVHPVPGARITQHFYQNPANYNQWGLSGHDGCDFGIAEGTSIKSMAFGVVAYSGWDDNYGFYVRIAHDAFLCYSFYAHLKEHGLAAGSVVQAGDTIGKVGSTGNSTGPHLHFEIRLQNVDGTYKVGTPMPKGRCDPQTWFAIHGVRL